MSLTSEAYSERKWGSFPALRKILADKRVPSDYYGFTSASDNMFDATIRLMEIAVIASEYKSDIKENAVSIGREEIWRDLKKLQKCIEDASHFLKSKAEEIEATSLSL